MAALEVEGRQAQLEYQSRNRIPNVAASNSATMYRVAEELVASAFVRCMFPRSVLTVAATAWANHQPASYAA